MAAIHDIRFERLAREAPDSPLPLTDEDREYVARHLQAVADAFAVAAVPGVPLSLLSGRALATHLARLRVSLDPKDQDQALALGRLESVFRLVASAVRLSRLQSRQKA